MSLYDRLVPAEALDWGLLTHVTSCPEFVDDGMTRLCAECGWWRSSHRLPPEPAPSWLPWRKRR